MVNGNTSGLKEYILENLDELYNSKIEKGKIINQEIIDYIAELSNKINREINIAMDRSGKVIDISIGDSSTVNLPVENSAYSSRWKSTSFLCGYFCTY